MPRPGTDRRFRLAADHIASTRFGKATRFRYTETGLLGLKRQGLPEQPVVNFRHM